MTVAFVAGRVLTGKGGAPEKPAPVPERVLAFDALAERFPPRPTPRGWPQTGYDRGQVLELASSPRFGFGLSRLESNRRGLPLLLDWLAGQEGGTWQERWMSSGADGDGEGWAAGLAAWLESRGMLTGDRLRHIAACLMVLVGADVLRPSVSWLLTGGKNRKFALDMVRARDSEGFGKLHLACEQDPGISALAEAHTVFRCTVVVTAKGGKLADITVGDVMELFGTEDRCRTDWHSRHATFKVLRDMGVLGPGVPSLRELRNIGQLSAEELVDRYPVVCRPVRDLLVGYLKERQPSVDYGTLGSLSFALVRCFWADLEAHHPGIDSLRLGPEVASAWKARVRTKKVITRTGHGDAVEVSAERLGYFDVLSTVRAFYLDLAEWAQDDPGRWGPWAAPCPVRRHELSRRKFLRQRKARMDARTRERLPVLPQLLRAAHQWRRDAAVLLAAGREVPPGEQFEAAGEALVRVAMVRGRTSEGNVWAEGPAGSRRRLLNREEEHAFWAWAVIEVLRFTGLRVEELLELSHHSLVKYSLPTTGELVPLLQVAPSKTDAERLLVVSPELADVLSEVIGRSPGRRRGGPPGARLGLPRACLAGTVTFVVPAPSAVREPGVHGQLYKRPHQRSTSAHRARGGRRQATALQPSRFPADVHHRSRHERPAPAHRPGDRRPPQPEHHHGLQGRLPRRGAPGTPSVPGPPPRTPPERGIPNPHRGGVASLFRPLREAQGLHRHMRAGLRDAVHPRARLRALRSFMA
ncbi:MAG TPA: hypothetical protein VME46_25630 [Acidimicrobiales bacterium]|nr:hypothetical protein [Acidimicrobiales bacterium]